MATILLSAGDVSGERHAAALVETLRARRADLRFLGLGGERMRAAGVEIVVDQRELAVGGLVELLPELGRVWRAWRRLSRALRDAPPDLVILVDSGGFNLPFARRVRRRSQARILYFVAPQVWAWRSERLERLAERADRIVVALPLERDYYARRGVAVEFFGHPIVDAFARARSSGGDGQEDSERRAAGRRRLDLPLDAPLLGLFPGSRRNELRHHLPHQLEAVARLRSEPGGPGERLLGVIGLAPGLSRAELRRAAPAAFDSAVAQGLLVRETADGALLDALDVALVKPGTITLEAALHGCPMVVIARAHPFSVWLARRSAQVESVALPNLIADAVCVPELVQADATPARIAAALAPLFAGPARAAQRAALARVVERLGPPGATDAVADVVEEMLGSARA
ncbi:MAG: lipid-A-disaccharide synthase [Myxococcota bacterium]